MRSIIPMIRRRRTRQLDLVNAQLAGIGAQLSVLCRLTAGDPVAEPEQPEAEVFHLHLAGPAITHG
jgi:hypothetical protein